MDSSYIDSFAELIIFTEDAACCSDTGITAVPSSLNAELGSFAVDERGTTKFTKFVSCPVLMCRNNFADDRENEK